MHLKMHTQYKCTIIKRILSTFVSYSSLLTCEFVCEYFFDVRTTKLQNSIKQTVTYMFKKEQNTKQNKNHRNNKKIISS